MSYAFSLTDPYAHNKRRTFETFIVLILCTRYLGNSSTNPPWLSISPFVEYSFTAYGGAFLGHSDLDHEGHKNVVCLCEIKIRSLSTRVDRKRHLQFGIRLYQATSGNEPVAIRETIMFIVGYP